MKFELVATCLFGLEKLLGEEIEELGYEKTSVIDGRVSFFGDAEAVALANIKLRFAERVYIKLGGFRAESFDALFEGVRALPWEEFIGKCDAFPVKGHSVRSALVSIPDCQAIVKKAIVTRLSQVYGLQIFPETGVKYQVVFFLLNNEAALMIDTSGDPLYKRGYRRETGDAPIRETLAAAIAKLSRPREEVLLWDPMCGSGTIAIEAAMMMRGIAPGVRRSFAAERYPFVPEAVWNAAREEAREEEHPSAFRAYASDIDPAMLSLAEDNARRAGVADAIKVFRADAALIRKPEGVRGTIVTNPPYGERLGSLREAEQLYRRIGGAFRAMAPWQVYVITSHPAFEKLYGRRADKVRKLYNGMIPCYLYQYFKNDRGAEGTEKPDRRETGK